MKVAIIGGGAAGFFSAITAKEKYPEAEVVIFEKSKKLLSKVKISGGGRCNLTNALQSRKEFLDAYPRGKKLLKTAFKIFDNNNTMQWFESRGVPLVIQEDNCVFPKSQDSTSITNTLIHQAKSREIEIKINHGVKKIHPQNNKLQLIFIDSGISSLYFDKVIVTTGGSPRKQGLEWLQNLGHKIKDPVPSLFTFNMPDESITKLMGIVIENTLISLPGSKLKSTGALLVTHWGMSGPAVLKISSLGAIFLNEENYHFQIKINWINKVNNESVKIDLNEIINKNPKKLLSNIRPYLLPERLWLFLLDKAKLPPNKKWSELGKKGINKIINILTNDLYKARGKTTFREEFVTCGGVSLESIDMTTMQSKVVNNLYFAGEILDIDGITGGFNLQAAWTTGYIAGQLK
jgi:predicted Rossmann fold flavoprotein